MARTLLALTLAATVAGCGGSGSRELRGAGSTLVAPLVEAWARGDGVPVAYAAVGSAGGVYQLGSGTVDFAASDAPLSPAQRSACRGCVALPWALSATAIAYHLAGLSRPLRLSGSVLAAVYRGAIERWDDPRIAALNPGVALPRSRIHVLFRSDASGDTFVFTRFLARASAGWRAAEGPATTALQWPVGTGAKGNAAMAEQIRLTPGSLGYVSLAQAFGSRLSVALVRNRAGAFAAPTTRMVAAATYPLWTFTYAVVARGSSRLGDLKAFLGYALAHQHVAVAGFAPLPRAVVAQGKRILAGL